MDQFDNMLAKWQPAALSLFRFITGLLLLQYGIAKIFKFPVLPMLRQPSRQSLMRSTARPARSNWSSARC